MFFLFLCSQNKLCVRDVPGDVGVVSYAGVTEHVGGPLGHQDFDLVYRAAELQEAQVETRGQPVSAAPLVRQNVLEAKDREKESFTEEQPGFRDATQTDSGGLPHLDGDDEDVEGVRLLGRGQRLPLALQFGHLHPLPAEQRVLALRVVDGHQQHVAVAVLDGLVVDPAQVVSSQKALPDVLLFYF